MYIHGLSETRFYRIWCGIMTRCTNANIPLYKYYGQRGIKCDWESFANFHADMYASYQIHVQQWGEANTFIERVNNDGNYCKNNCTWSTREEQARNKRSTRRYTYGDKTMCLGDWAKTHGIPRNTLMNRLNRGIPIETALTMKKCAHFTHTIKS